MASWTQVIIMEAGDSYRFMPFTRTLTCLVQHIPPAITIPLLAMSKHLEVQPIASYAALNLWNWRRLTENSDLTDPDNLEALNTLTGSEDESWFYVISVAMESRAVPIIRTMMSAIEAADEDDAVSVTSALTKLRQSLVSIAELLERMDERCDPQYFYHQIRPLLAGTVNMENTGLAEGIFYDEGNGRGKWRKYRGGSNGQSSLIQFFDAVLGVQHFDKGGFHKVGFELCTSCQTKSLMSCCRR